MKYLVLFAILCFTAEAFLPKRCPFQCPIEKMCCLENECVPCLNHPAEIDTDQTIDPPGIYCESAKECPPVNATNFPNAEIACTKLNGHLTSIHDGFTNAVITGQSGNYFHESTDTNFWIGLNSLMTPGNWSWTDNSSFNFKEWAASEPQNLTMSCGVITIQNGYWAADDCFKVKPYVCEIPNNVYPVYMNCSLGWMYFEPTHSCYGLDGYGSYDGNWTKAEKYCLYVNSHLVSLHSYDELKFVSTLISMSSSNVWTGLYSNDDEKTWKWSDGSPVDYLPWRSGYPNRNVSSCAFVWDEYIVDYSCDTLFRTLCKKPALT